MRGRRFAAWRGRRQRRASGVRRRARGRQAFGVGRGTASRPSASFWHAGGSGREPAQHGATLIELLTSTLFVSILMAMSYTFTRAILMSAGVQQVKSEAQEVTVMAVDILARELRMAGYSATGNPVTAIRAAAVDRVEVAADFNGDGDTADTDEVIEYLHDPDKRQLMRATAGGTPQPLVSYIAPAGVRFAYFDAAGTLITAAEGSVASTDFGRIRRIDATISVELQNPAPGAPALTSTTTTSVWLRNQ